MKKKVFVSLVMVLMLMVSGASAGKTGVLAESLFGEKNCLGLGICPGDWFDPFYLPDGVTIRGEDITDIWGYGNYNTPIEEGFFNMFWEQPGFPDLKVSFG
ncbi:MAG TPA: hypothetical protein DIT25_00300, partial [Candidatus Moranbacteria bacterium]|nr:hypothetical protein [Candidatus Moranbacteria bacterium]